MAAHEPVCVEKSFHFGIFARIVIRGKPKGAAVVRIGKVGFLHAAEQVDERNLLHCERVRDAKHLK